MNQLVLFGAYGFGNLGDKLLAEYYRSLVYSAFPDYLRWVVATGGIYPIYPGERILTRRQVPTLLMRVNPGVLWIAGGGSLLQNRTSRRSLLFYLTILEGASLRGGRILMLGQGYGPIYGRIWEKAARHGLSRAGLIECRDRLTYQQLQTVSSEKTQIVKGVDPGWSIETPRLVGKGDTLLLILRRTDQAKIPKILMGLSQNGFDEKIKVIALDGKDERALKTVCGSKFRGIADSLSIFWKFVAEARGILSTRLHGLILGLAAGVPVIGLGNDPKIAGLCDEFGLPINTLQSSEDYQSLPNLVLSLSYHSEISRKVQMTREQAHSARETMSAILRRLGEQS